MGWALGFAVYFVIWWIALFVVLPFGVHSQHEMNDIVPGTEPGAPARPRLGLKILINTGVAGILWAITNFIYVHYYLPQ
jgi:predicted secreted protein